MTCGRTVYFLPSRISVLHSQSSSSVSSIPRLRLSRGIIGRKYEDLHILSWASSSSAIPQPTHRSYSTIPRSRILRSSLALRKCSNCRFSRSIALNRGYPPTQRRASSWSSLKAKRADPSFYRTQFIPLKSNFDPWAAAAVTSLLAILYALFTGDAERSTPQSANPPPSKALSDTLYILENDDDDEINMAEGPLPGRVGNLTAEQEERLKELWVATLQVFGVLDQKEKEEDAPKEGTKRADSAGPKKQKKKRLGIFRRSKETDTEPLPTTEPGVPIPTTISESEDKYGQAKDFIDALASQSPETIRAALWSMVKHDHPDALLLRFLRARKWDVEKALVMMIATMKWRAKDLHVDDDIMKNGELGSLEEANGEDAAKKKFGEDFLTQLRMGKSFLHGLDKDGRPMCVVRVRLHRQGEQSEESLERYTVFIIETARMVIQPPTDTACIVFDMTGFSLANMDYAPVKFMIKCFEANYPESLGVVLVHKAPWVFQGIWKIIKGWLDPVVASKVNFTNSIEEMAEFIPMNRIMTELGGDEDWSYSYVEPVAGENDKMKDVEMRDKILAERETTVKEFEKATLEWIRSTDANAAAAAREKRHEVARELRDGYWVLDPYVRARSYYDRIGMIGPGGEPIFYPPKKEEEKKKVEGEVEGEKKELGTSNGVTPSVETTEDDLD